MRFALAASILAQLLHHVDCDVLVPGGERELRAADAESLASKRDGTIARQILVRRGLQKSKDDSLISPNEQNSESGRPSWLSRISASRASAIGSSENHAHVQECDPHESDEDADVGILSCGTNRYCVESEDSKFGGICMDSTPRVYRGLQSFGEFCTTPPEGYTCDCSSFADGVGTITCEATAEYCVEQLPTICGSTTLDFVLTDGAFTSEYCFDFTSGLNYDRVCYGYTSAGTCSVEIDDVECSSCALAPCAADAADNSTDAGAFFNCTNIVANSAGDSCNEYLFLAIVDTLVAAEGLPPTDPRDTDPPAMTPTAPPATDPPATNPPATNPPATNPPATTPTAPPVATFPPTEAPGTNVTNAPSKATSLLSASKVAIVMTSAVTLAFAFSFAV